MHFEKVLQAIFDAVEELNQQLPPDRRLARSPDTVLLGNAAKLDSLGLVALIVTAEQTIEDRFGLAVTLADDRAMAQKNSPFKTIGTLADYAALLIEDTIGA
jgi:D-alanine--poly(phosphoribitol) ligase subunit 2